MTPGTPGLKLLGSLISGLEFLLSCILGWLFHLEMPGLSVPICANLIGSEGSWTTAGSLAMGVLG